MSNVTRSISARRIARIVVAACIVLGVAWDAVPAQPGASTVDEDMVRAVATAAEIAAQRDTEAREAQAAANAALEEAAEAQARADAALDRAQALEAQANATQAERDAARAEAETLRAEAAEKEAARVALEQRADTALEQAREAQARAATLERQLVQEQRHFYLALVAASLALLAVILVAWRFASRRRLELAASEAARRASEEQLAAAVTAAPFSCLLEGTDTNGRSVVVKIGAEQLGSRDGIVVGRNPAQAGVVLDHPEASREHFRLAATGRSISIVDLHSTNGTFVNGTEIEPDKATVLSSGDEIRVGAAIRLTVSIDRVAP